ncbi:MAG: nucleotide disphospho-sugar-binding domain-containing protein [Vicinamibacterales bacterium]
MLRVVICGTLGAAGEVRPLIAVGAELARRGHAVLFVGNPYYERTAVDAGLTFTPVGTVADQERLMADDGLFGGGADVKSGRLIFNQHYFDKLADHYRVIDQALQSFGRAIVVGQDAAASMVAEKRLLPRVRLVIAPGRMPSRFDPPHPERLLPAWARWITRTPRRMTALDRLRDLRQGVLTRESHRMPVFPETHPLPVLRRQLDLPALDASRGNRARLVLCLWPDWFAAPQRDWPAEAVTVGFPLEGNSGSAEPGDDGGAGGRPRPIVATTGSLARGQFEFFSKVAAACARLGRPGVLVTPHRDHVPRELPPRVTYMPYAPFDELFQGASMVIHHGGIGTTARALWAGVPQIAAPMRGEQFDVGNRVVRLGVAEMLSIDDVAVDHLARLVSAMTSSERIRRACERWRLRLAREDGVCQAGNLIEALQDQVAGARSRGSDVA